MIDHVWSSLRLHTDASARFAGRRGPSSTRRRSTMNSEPVEIEKQPDSSEAPNSTMRFFFFVFCDLYHGADARNCKRFASAALRLPPALRPSRHGCADGAGVNGVDAAVVPPRVPELA